jgi:hypothetical protein
MATTLGDPQLSNSALFCLIACKSPAAVAGCQSALLKLASHAVLCPTSHGTSSVGFAVLAASPTNDIKLKASPFNTPVE